MRPTSLRYSLALVLTLGTTAAFAQSSSGSSADRLIRMNGALPVTTGTQVGTTELVEFAIYDQETGGTLLWQETQALSIDGSGGYSVFLGAMTDGLPVELFAGGAARWLSVQRAGGPAAARSLLTAVPYAVSAANADTLGGRPAGDYLLTPAARRSDSTKRADGSAAGANDDPVPLVNNGTANFIGKFFNNVDLINSSLYDAGGLVGLNTTTPLDVFHSRFTNAGGSQTGIAVQNLSGGATAYSGMLFYDHTGALRQFQGYNNSTGEYRINNISPTASINFMTGSTSAFRINTNRSVEINGSTTSTALRVARADTTYVDVSGDGFSGFSVTNSTGDIPWFMYRNPSHALNFFRGGDLMTILPTGNVGIGTGAPASRLDVAGDIRTSSNVRTLGTSLLGLKWYDAGGTLQADIFRFGAVNDRLYVTNNGTGNLTGVYLASGGVTWTSTSDERLKVNVDPVTGILDKIKNVRVVGYDMFATSVDKATGRPAINREITPRVTRAGRVIKHQIGSIAQDWIKDFPELVVEPKSADDFYGLDYDRIGIVALGGVKELNALVEQKDAEIKALTERLAALEAALKTLTTNNEQR